VNQKVAQTLCGWDRETSFWGHRSVPLAIPFTV
jgi:hypothetical protein